MARKIIILDEVGLPSDLTYNVAFWLDVAAARQPFMANDTAISRVIGATAGELAAIKAGQIVEVVRTISYVSGTALGVIVANLVARHNLEQAYLTANNPWNRYGTSWDGTTWTQVTVA